MQLTVAVFGCVHGELDMMYDTLEKAETENGVKVDLLICCGDFQAVRTEHDLGSMAVPPKYRSMKTFHRYYSGERTAPVLTIFIGGNHEASNYLWQLPYGGWVAPNIYYMGRASVLNFKGLRIAGLSGIYKKYDYLRGLFEVPPFGDDQRHSVYHVRSVDVFRLKLLAKPLHVVLTHDWPRGIDRFGDRDRLLWLKPHFRHEADRGELGSLPSFELLKMLAPDYWFAAHMHVKFAAYVPQPGGKATRFLALDKCIPSRPYFQILKLDVGDQQHSHDGLCYDAEWLAVLKKTDHLVNVSSSAFALPLGEELSKCVPDEQDIGSIMALFNDDLTVPDASNFNGVVNEATALETNPQTDRFCEILQIQNVVTLLLNSKQRGDAAAAPAACLAPEEKVDSVVTSAEICLDDE